MKSKILLILILSYLTVHSQNLKQQIWNEVVSIENERSTNKPSIELKTYELNEAYLKMLLLNVPRNREDLNLSSVTISIPNEKGVFNSFKMADAAVLSPELQLKFPNIKSYIGESKDGTVIRISMDPYRGFNAIILNKSIAPTVIFRDGDYYKVISEKDMKKRPYEFDCKIKEELFTSNDNLINSVSINGQLRTYKLALVTNGEYSQLVLNDLGISDTAAATVKKTAILGHLNMIMTTVNSVFERDAALTMQLVSNNESIIFLDPTTDGLGNSTSIPLLSTNQQICDNIIGNSNYDIAHLLTTGSGGVAALGSVCNNSNKAKGTSGIAPPGYYPFNLQYNAIIHEIGHQYGATHTFNNCDIGTPDSLTGVETGAGTTIMSYHNSCLGNQTIYSYSDLFFHSVNINQIRNYIQNNGNCAATINSGNVQPIADAGNDYIIPKSTPFLLEGIASDANNSNLTYTWEQINPESAISPPTSVATQGPVFRWLPPSTSPNRYLPNLTTILNGDLSNRWEVLPSVSRGLDFLFLARDNNSLGGDTSADTMNIIVDGNSGPFLITSQNNSTIWYSGSIQNITWDVAGTDSGLGATPTVDILFSTDGGNTFSTSLATNIPNNGSASVQVPFGIPTGNGRLMVKGHNNIFLDINNSNINVQEKDFLVEIPESQKIKTICVNNQNSVTFDFIYNAFRGFNGTVSFSASPINGTGITFSPSSTNTSGTVVSMNISNISSSILGQNIISITATSGTSSHTENAILNVYDRSLNTVNLTTPANGETNFLEPFTFEWIANNNANNYKIQIATDVTFSNIIADEFTSLNQFTTSLLNYATRYYWRVQPLNDCTVGAFSSISTFVTQTNNATDTYVPDDAFEQALINLGYDSGPLDDYVPTANISSVTSLNLDDLGISSLVGIEDFTALQTLGVRNFNMPTNLDSLDLSQNTELVTVYAYYNSITSIDVSNSPNLLILGLFDNQLTSINLTNNPRLSFLDVARNNLTNIEINQNVNLENLSIYDNLMSTIDLSSNPSLEYLAMGNSSFHPSNNSFTSLDLSNNLQLNYLSVGNNLLSVLDLSNKPNLERVYAANNQISNINLNGAVSLEVLDLTNNQLTQIDLSECIDLVQLQVADNNLSCLDVTNNTDITHFYCSNNQITALDLTNNTALTRCEFQNNNLEILDLKNGNNESFSNTFSKMDATNNPNLSCINVDNQMDANSQNFPYNFWVVNTTTSYSETCNYSTIDLDSDGVIFSNDECPCTDDGVAVNSDGCSAAQLSLNESNLLPLTLYPNPVTNILYINNENSLPIKKVEIFSLGGKRLYNNNQQVSQINISNFSSGLYILRYTDKDGRTYHDRIIKK